MNFGVKKNSESQSDSGNGHHTPTRGNDNLHAGLRRALQRIVSLEEQVSTLRRDINATRKKVYREEHAPHQETSGTASPFAGLSYPVRRS